MAKKRSQKPVEVHYPEDVIAEAAARKARIKSDQQFLRDLARPTADSANTKIDGWVVEIDNHNDDPAGGWSGFHTPAEWQDAWQCGESKWRQLRDSMKHEQHPISKARSVRFLTADLEKMGLSEPQ